MQKIPVPRGTGIFMSASQEPETDEQRGRQIVRSECASLSQPVNNQDPSGPPEESPCASSPLALFCASLLSCSLAQALELGSPDIHDGQPLSNVEEYAGFGCQGQNRAPALNWKDAPAGTQSFAITVYDPDAPTGSGWWHWLLFNLPASSTSLPATSRTTTSSLCMR